MENAISGKGEGQRLVGPFVVAYSQDRLQLKMLNFVKSEHVTERAGEEERSKQQQVFVTDLEDDVGKVKMFRNESAVHVMHEFARFDR